MIIYFLNAWFWGQNWPFKAKKQGSFKRIYWDYKGLAWPAPSLTAESYQKIEPLMEAEKDR